MFEGTWFSFAIRKENRKNGTTIKAIKKLQVDEILQVKFAILNVLALSLSEIQAKLFLKQDFYPSLIR
jgi:hypothetical protein